MISKKGTLNSSISLKKKTRSEKTGNSQMGSR